MDMDDDDFIGEIEFNLSSEQGAIVSQAISVASSAGDDEFRAINPLIAIMQWWEANRADDEPSGGGAEGTLVEICRRYLANHKT